MEKLDLLTEDQVKNIVGGEFGYDAGFFLRECWIYISNGAGITGHVAVATDLAINYDGANNSL